MDAKRYAPGVLFGEGALPQLLWRGEGFGLPLLARVHVNGVNALAVAGVGETQLELGGVFLGLAHAFGEWQGIGLGLHHRQGGVAVAEHVVGTEGLAAAAAALNAPRGNRKLAANAAALHHAPTGRHQQRVDQLSAGFGLVHGSGATTSAEGVSLAYPAGDIAPGRHARYGIAASTSGWLAINSRMQPSRLFRQSRERWSTIGRWD